jgi:putative PIN family toxin of toxin-antitoxin system
MIRVVLDTNVFVSALLIPDSPPARILEFALKGNLRLVMSPGIIKEIGSVFNYPRLKKSMKKHRLSDGEVADAILQLLKIAIITPGAEIASGTSRDPADDMVLSCAVEGQADFIVSGDQDLIKLESYEGVKIVTPSAFLKIIAEGI